MHVSRRGTTMQWTQEQRHRLLAQNRDTCVDWNAKVIFTRFFCGQNPSIPIYPHFPLFSLGFLATFSGKSHITRFLNTLSMRKFFLSITCIWCNIPFVLIDVKSMDARLITCVISLVCTWDVEKKPMTTFFTFVWKRVSNRFRCFIEWRTIFWINKSQIEVMRSARCTDLCNLKEVPTCPRNIRSNLPKRRYSPSKLPPWWIPWCTPDAPAGRLFHLHSLVRDLWHRLMEHNIKL